MPRAHQPPMTGFRTVWGLDRLCVGKQPLNPHSKEYKQQSKLLNGETLYKCRRCGRGFNVKMDYLHHRAECEPFEERRTTGRGCSQVGRQFKKAATA